MLRNFADDGSFLIIAPPHTALTSSTVRPNFLVRSTGEQVELKPLPGYEWAIVVGRMSDGHIIGYSEKNLPQKGWTDVENTIWTSAGGEGRLLKLPSDKWIVKGCFGDGTIVAGESSDLAPIYLCPPNGAAPQAIPAKCGIYPQIADNGTMMFGGADNANGVKGFYVWKREGASGVLYRLAGKDNEGFKIEAILNLNRKGQVVGTIQNPRRKKRYEGVWWSSPQAEPSIVPQLASDIYTVPRAIADDGTIVGYGFLNGGDKFTPFILSPGKPMRVIALANSSDVAAYHVRVAEQINSKGQILARAKDEDGSDTVLLLTPVQ